MLCLVDSAYHSAQGLQSFTQWLYLTQHWIHVRCISWLTGIVESPEHDRHVKVYILHPSALSTAFKFLCYMLWHVFTAALFVEPGDWWLLEVMQNQTVSGAILSGCCDHMGQHMELFPLLSLRDFLDMSVGP